MERYIIKKALGYVAKDPESQNAFFHTLSGGNRALTGQLLAGCVREGNVDQRIVKLVSSTTFELSLVHAATNQPSSLRANGAAEQVVTKESIGG